MDTLTFYQDTIEKILEEYAAIPYSYGEVRQYVIVNADRTHFLLFDEGWEKNHRVHGCVVHIEIRDGKIWMHYDGIEDSITADLVEAGVPKDHIVLAFHPLNVRQHTGYAIA